MSDNAHIEPYFTAMLAYECNKKDTITKNKNVLFCFCGDESCQTSSSLLSAQEGEDNLVVAGTVRSAAQGQPGAGGEKKKSL